MSCCGQKRAALTSPAPAYTLPASTSAAVSIRYLHDAPIMVRGPSTGRHYQFTAATPVQRVDATDAEPLVRSGYFRSE